MVYIHITCWKKNEFVAGFLCENLRAPVVFPSWVNGRRPQGTMVGFMTTQEGYISHGRGWNWGGALKFP